jgi:hypothetical protein
MQRLQRALNNETSIEADEPELILDQKETAMDLHAPPRVPTT